MYIKVSMKYAYRYRCRSSRMSRKRPHSQDHRTAIGKCPLRGPRGGRFLMSEGPLYCITARPGAHFCSSLRTRSKYPPFARLNEGRLCSVFDRVNPGWLCAAFARVNRGWLCAAFARVNRGWLCAAFARVNRGWLGAAFARVNRG